MRLIKWNVAGRVTRSDEQIKALAVHEPDLIALQEVTAKTAPLLRARLKALGLANQQDSFSLCATPASLIGPRRFGQLVAARWPTRGGMPFV